MIRLYMAQARCSKSLPCTAKNHRRVPRATHPWIVFGFLRNFVFHKQVNTQSVELDKILFKFCKQRSCNKNTESFLPHKPRCVQAPAYAWTNFFKHRTVSVYTCTAMSMNQLNRTCTEGLLKATAKRADESPKPPILPVCNFLPNLGRTCARSTAHGTS